MIIAIIGLVIMGFILGFSCRKSDTWHETVQLQYEIEKAKKIPQMEMRIFQLERDNEQLNCIYRSMEAKKRHFEEEYMAHCHYCAKNFYSKTPDEQKVADLLKSITLSSEEIAKKLDIRIV